ncbi:hypothetical protein BKA83DRAFT_4128154 [Pisolithus microcarpus]|nr:hypothetical protein BKA83DRAFT_4128154 [Pisolithus microcarpus]
MEHGLWGLVGCGLMHAMEVASIIRTQDAKPAIALSSVVRRYHITLAYDRLVCVSDYPVVLEVALTDVTVVVVSGNSTSTTLPCTNQLNFTALLWDTVLISEVFGDGTAVNLLQAFVTLGVLVKA